MKDLFKNENFKLIVLLASVAVILTSILLIAFFIGNKNNQKRNEYNNTTNALIDKSMKGFIETKLDTSNIKYNIYEKYEFVYGSVNEQSITTNEEEMEFTYDLVLVNGKLTFKERYFDYNKNAFISTNKTYNLEVDNEIKEFFVSFSRDKKNYAIVALDSKGIIYYYVNNNSEVSINDILENFKRYKAISTVKRIGYYTLNNSVDKEAGYELIYVDKDNNVRRLNSKNDFFYKDLYYTYLENNGEYIIINEDGRMHMFNDTSFLNINGNAVYYAGSFNKDNYIYIIGKDLYLYKIDITTKQITRENNKINRMGYHIITDESGHDINKRNIKFIFEDNKELVIENTTNLNILF